MYFLFLFLDHTPYSPFAIRHILSSALLTSHPATLFRGPNLAEDMLRKGWATTYEQHGAEYGEGGVERYKQIEQEAKDARRGIWAKGVRGETPAEYKRR